MSLMASCQSVEEAEQVATGILVRENLFNPASWFIDCFHKIPFSEWLLKAIL